MQMLGLMSEIYVLSMPSSSSICARAQFSHSRHTEVYSADLSPSMKLFIFSDLRSSRHPPMDILNINPSGTPSSKAVLKSLSAYHAFTYSPKASPMLSSDGCSEEKVLSPMAALGFSAGSGSGNTVFSSKKRAPAAYAAIIPCAV